ncbi:MAG: T9SS type A sorting domain-containing protein [Bacteroidetes bacterium]|nr:T9SS type A sorting domain-containing protein [Bacteroidota bacterium]
MKNLLLQFMILSAFVGNSQSFIRKAGANDIDHLKKIIALNNNYYLAGNTYSLGTSHIQVIKTDLNGNQLWNSIAQGNVNDFTADLVNLNGSKILSGGTTRKIVGSQNISDGYLQLQNQAGTILWQKTYSVMGNETYFTSIVNTNDSGIAVLGGYYDNMNNNINFLSKLDSNGVVQWIMEYSGSGFLTSDNLLQLSNNDFLITGSIGLGFQMNNAVAYRVSSTGNLIWSEIINYDNVNSQNSSFYHAAELPSGNILLSGYSDYFGSGAMDYIVTKITGNGALINNTYYGTNQIDWLYDANYNPVTNKLILCGESGGIGNPSQSDGLLLSIDTTGILLGSWAAGDTSASFKIERINSIIQSPSDFIGVGYEYDQMNSQDDYYFFKHSYSTASCINYTPSILTVTSTPVIQSLTLTSNIISLTQTSHSLTNVSFYNDTTICSLITTDLPENEIQIDLLMYPNPTSSNFHIESIGDLISEVTVFDLIGRRVHTENNKSRLSNLDLTLDLSTGTYIVRIKTESGRVVSKKILIAKE